MAKDKTKIIYKRPPHWRIIKLFFPQYDPNGSIACAFGKVIYANNEIPDDYIAHEEEHLNQQFHSYIMAVLWWICYCLSKHFRYSQELGAFQRQYQWICKNQAWRRHQKLYELAEQLASPLYGSMISIREAQREILRHEK